MHSRKKVKLTFASAVIFLAIAAIAAGLVITRLTASLNWIAHTYDVQVGLGDLSTTMTALGRARAAFDSDGGADDLRAFDTAAALVAVKLDRLAVLVADNPEQADSMARLRGLEEQRRQMLKDAVNQRKLGPRGDD